MKRLFTRWFLACILGIFMPLFVFAQGGVGITVTPLKFELTANPGEAISNNIRVTNSSGGSVMFEMSLEDFTAVGESGEVILEAEGGDEAYSMRKWVTFSPERFTLGPNESQAVNFSIAVPENAEPGGRYVSILAGVKGSADAGGAAIAQRIASLVLLTVSGPIREELFIREFTVPSFQQTGPVLFTVRFENTGSVHVRPMGFITIADFSGRKAADILIPQKQVMPGTTRKLEVRWDRQYPIGKFTATLVGSFGISNTPISAVTTFWVFPWKIALELLAAVVLIVLILIKTRRRFRAAFRILFRGEHKEAQGTPPVIDAENTHRAGR